MRCLRAFSTKSGELLAQPPFGRHDFGYVLVEKIFHHGQCHGLVRQPVNSQPPGQERKAH